MNYKDLSNAEMIAFDIETFDPNLKEMGPGNYRKDGYILGYSLADGSGWKEYFNLGHPDCDRVTKNKNIEYLKEVMALPCPKVGANLQYDIGWVETEYETKCQGAFLDVAIAEALLDENLPSYSLESISQKYLNKGKTSNKIEQICEENGWKGVFRTHLYKLDYKDVREYGQDDAEFPLKIMRTQLKLLASQDLMDVFDMETKLVRVILMMRNNGVRIDEDKRRLNALELMKAIEERKTRLVQTYGEFNWNSSTQIAKVLDSLGAVYPRNPTGSPKMNKASLKALSEDYPVCNDILEIRKLDKLYSTFIEGGLHTAQVNNRIHASFYNTKTETMGALSGTVTGRFSMAKPNLQQIPAFDPKEKDAFKHWYTRLCRELFIPEHDCFWASLDYSQIEYRFMAHFAVNAGDHDTSGDDVRATYQENPYTDYHEMIQQLTGLPRKLAKTLNFGVGYGMGKKTMSETFGWSMEYVEELLDTYHSKAPFMKATMNAVGAKARQQTFIRTFMKRRRRLVDPRKAYAMFNALCQGSAADLAKKAMVDSYDAGLYDVMKLHFAVHDELDMSVPKTKIGIEALKEQKYIMENALKLRVPVIADTDVGDNWADLVSMEEGLAKYGLQA